jgi:hypothetical protein
MRCPWGSDAPFKPVVDEHTGQHQQTCRRRGEQDDHGQAAQQCAQRVPEAEHGDQDNEDQKNDQRHEELPVGRTGPYHTVTVLKRPGRRKVPHHANRAGKLMDALIPFQLARPLCA